MARGGGVKRYCEDSLAPAFWEQACQDLSSDPVWARLIAQHPDRAVRSRGAPFFTLARAIVGQQISVKAADAVWNRVVTFFRGNITPLKVLRARDEDLRAQGLSVRKVAYFKSLAQFARDGGLNEALLAGMDDEACVAHLVQIHGIGRWTAEMFLIFNLMRPDVWPVDDLGVLKALGLLLGMESTPTPKAAKALGEPLKPWRTVATWYLWRSLDPIAVDY